METGYLCDLDEDLKIFPTVVLDDKNDRDIVKKYISLQRPRVSGLLL